jgi:mono/diheme cytochrome c family protein
MSTLERTSRLAMAVSAMVSGVSLAGDAQTPAAVGRGQFIVEERCAGCHKLGATVQGTAAPSFIALAARSNLTAERLKDLITTPKHPMPAAPLEPAELDAVVAYIRSLR